MPSPGRASMVGAGALLVLVLVASDVRVWTDRGLLPGPGVVETVAGIYRREARVPAPPDLEVERLYGPPPAGTPHLPPG